MLHRLTAIAGLLLGGAFLRRRLMQLGATPEEAEASMPGDGLLPSARKGSTMATTLLAPPAEVWPWLAQMGADRAGWYSVDLLDNGGRRSAGELVADWQEIRVGDRLLTDRGGRTWFTVAEVEPERSLVLRQRLDAARMRTVPDDELLPCVAVDSTWAFRLDPVSGGGTRLVVRGRGLPRPRALRIFDLLIWDPAHVLMQWVQFRNLRRRVEQPG